MIKSDLFKNEINSILIQINKQIDDRYNKENHIGVLSGLSGVLLFKYYFAIYSKTDFVNNITNSIFEEITNKINQGKFVLSFCSGLAGFAWVLNYLNLKTTKLDIDINKYLKNIDEVLVIQMRKDISENNFDFLHGALGYGYYFLERYKSNPGYGLEVIYKNYIQESLTFLKDLAEENEEGIKWPMKTLDQEINTTIYNFGLAHGLPSIIFYLTEVYKSGISKNLCNRLIRGCIKYLLNNKLLSPPAISIFPTAIKKDLKHHNESSRLAWCYGDMGIASVIFNASLALEDENLTTFAISIMDHSSKRLEPNENYILDAPICHGAFGVAYLFKKMYLKVPMINLQQAALYWFKYGISFYKEYNIDGFKSLDALNDKYNENLGVLEGLSGIGLTLISFVDEEISSDWDKCLML